MEFHPIRLPGMGSYWQLTSPGKSARDLTRDAVLASPLWKQSGHFSKDWAQRFCVLKQMSVLMYFENEDAAEPKGVFLLDERSSCDTADSVSGRNHVLEVQQGSHAMKFSADSQSELADWQDAFRKCRKDVREQEVTDLRNKLLISQAETAALHATVKTLKSRLHEQDDALFGLNTHTTAAAATEVKAEQARHAAMEAAAAELERVTDEMRSLCSSLRANLSSEGALDDDDESVRFDSAGIAELTRKASSDLVAEATGFAAAVHQAHRVIDATRSAAESLQSSHVSLRIRSQEVARALIKAEATRAWEGASHAAQQGAWRVKETRWAQAVVQLSARLQRERCRVDKLAKLSSKRAEKAMEEVVVDTRMPLKARASLHTPAPEQGHASPSASPQPPLLAEAEADSGGGGGLEVASTHCVEAHSEAEDSRLPIDVVEDVVAVVEVTGDSDIHTETGPPPEGPLAAGMEGAVAVPQAESAHAQAPAVSVIESAVIPIASSSRSRAGTDIATPALLTTAVGTGVIPRAAVAVSFNPFGAGGAVDDHNPFGGQTGASVPMTATVSPPKRPASVPAQAQAQSGQRSLNRQTSAAGPAPGVGVQQPTQSLSAAPSTLRGSDGVSGLDILAANPHPGRLYVVVMGARNLPESAFGAPSGMGMGFSSGGRSSVVKVTALSFTGSDGRAVDKTSKPVEVTERARGSGLTAVYHALFPFTTTAPMRGSRVRIDVFNHRTLLRGDQLAGSSVVDLSALEEWPGQPHAVWCSLHGGGIPEHSHHGVITAWGGAPTPGEVPIPVHSSITTAPDADVEANMNLEHLYASAYGMRAAVGHEIALDARPAPAVNAGDDDHWASPSIPPPPADDEPAVLLQLVYCRSDSDRPALFATDELQHDMAHPLPAPSQGQAQSREAEHQPRPTQNRPVPAPPVLAVPTVTPASIQVVAHGLIPAAPVSASAQEGGAASASAGVSGPAARERDSAFVSGDEYRRVARAAAALKKAYQAVLAERSSLTADKVSLSAAKASLESDMQELKEELGVIKARRAADKAALEQTFDAMQADKMGMDSHRLNMEKMAAESKAKIDSERAAASEMRAKLEADKSAAIAAIQSERANIAEVKKAFAAERALVEADKATWTADKHAQESERARLKASLEKTQGELSTVNAEYAHARTALSAAEQTVRACTEDKSRLESETSRLEGVVAALHGDVSSAQSARESVAASLVSAQRERDEFYKSLLAAQTERDAARAEVIVAIAAAQETNTNTASVPTVESSEQPPISALIADATAAREAAAAEQLVQHQSMLAVAESKLLTAESHVTRLDAQLSAAQTHVSKMSASLAQAEESRAELSARLTACEVALESATSRAAVLELDVEEGRMEVEAARKGLAQAAQAGVEQALSAVQVELASSQGVAGQAQAQLAQAESSLAAVQALLAARESDLELSTRAAEAMGQRALAAETALLDARAAAADDQHTRTARVEEEEARLTTAVTAAVAAEHADGASRLAAAQSLAALYIEEAKAEVEEHVRAVHAARAELRVLQEERGRSTEEAGRLLGAVHDAESRATALSLELERVASDLARTRGEMESRASDLTETRAALASARAEADDARSRLAVLQAELERISALFSALSVEHRVLASSSHASTSAGSDMLRLAMSEYKSEWEGERAALAAGRETARVESAELRVVLARAEVEVEALRESKAALEGAWRAQAEGAAASASAERSAALMAAAVEANDRLSRERTAWAVSAAREAEVNSREAVERAVAELKGRFREAKAVYDSQKEEERGSWERERTALQSALDHARAQATATASSFSATAEMREKERDAGDAAAASSARARAETLERELSTLSALREAEVRSLERSGKDAVDRLERDVARLESAVEAGATAARESAEARLRAVQELAQSQAATAVASAHTGTAIAERDAARSEGERLKADVAVLMREVEGLRVALAAAGTGPEGGPPPSASPLSGAPLSLLSKPLSALPDTDRRAVESSTLFKDARVTWQMEHRDLFDMAIKQSTERLEKDRKRLAELVAVLEREKAGLLEQLRQARAGSGPVSGSDAGGAYPFSPATGSPQSMSTSPVSVGAAGGALSGLAAARAPAISAARAVLSVDPASYPRPGLQPASRAGAGTSIGMGMGALAKGLTSSVTSLGGVLPRKQ